MRPCIRPNLNEGTARNRAEIALTEEKEAGGADFADFPRGLFKIYL